MLRLTIAAFATLCVAEASAAPALSPSGYERLTVSAPHRPAPLAASVWYPVGSPTYKGLIGDNAVFQGTAAYIGAGIAEGRFPLVVLSHGSGGSMDTLSWLSSELVANGIMVLAVNHPGSTTGDSSPRRSILLADRAADLSVALDTLLANPVFGPHVDTSRIVTLGFSLGGATALNLAGAQMSRDAYQSYCDRLGERAHDCVFFAKGGVGFHALPATWENDMSDARVRAAIAIDPGMTYGMTAESVAAMKKPVLLINLGGDERWPAGDVSARGSGLSDQLPNATYAVVEPANHYTFLALCKAEGRDLLAAEGDDPVCDDPVGTDRAKTHTAVLERIEAFMAGLQ